MNDTPETDAGWACFKGYMEPLQDVQHLSRKLERERDEARHKLELCMAANSDVARIAKERDEAREQNAKLRDIAERAIEEMEGGDPVGTSDAYRAELDKIKEGAK